MRPLSAVLAALVAVGCSDPAPSAIGGSAELLANVQSDLVPATVFNTQMRSELEVPACTTESKGHAQVQVLQDGTIEAVVTINNKGAESVRFGHIHHVNPGATTGPVIWWLTTPVGTDLNLTEQHIDVAQQGMFVTNAHFTSHELGVAELLRDPGSFYVNFHSDVCPAGFARGFLP